MDQTNNMLDRLLGLCRNEINVIANCDDVLHIVTPLPAKPRNVVSAKRVLKDLCYVAWMLEGRRKEFLDGQAYEREYRAQSAAHEQAKARQVSAA